MIRIKGRTYILLALVLMIVAGLVIYIVKYVKHGSEWVSSSSNSGYYSGNVLKTGTIYDRSGVVLASINDGSRVYAEKKLTRISTLHAVGDKYGYIGTGALKAFSSKLIGYNLINGSYSLNDEGNKLWLTVDSKLNNVAYEALDGKKGVVAVCNYKTGEIICMVSAPSYDPENPPNIEEGGSKYEGVYINRFLSSIYTPGSTFKLITSIAAIENIGDISTRSYECEGKTKIGDSYITCTNTHGEVDFDEALAVSCNCFFGQLALELGADTLSKYASELGLTERFSIDGIKTASGSFVEADNQNDLAWSGIGQYKTQMNPAAMLRLMEAIAGNGKAASLRLISKSTDASGFPTGIYGLSGKTRLISSSTASALALMMRNNVTEIYGSDRFPGLEICAKSGTAEVGSDVSPHAWFVGFLNDSKNPYAFVVVVENGGRGSTVAGSIANKVLQAAISAESDE